MRLAHAAQVVFHFPAKRTWELSCLYASVENERIWHVLYEIRYFPFARRKQSANLRRGRAPYLPAGSDGLSKIWQKCVFLRARHSTLLFAWQWEMSRSSTGHLAGSCFAGTSIPEQDTNAVLLFFVRLKNPFNFKTSCALLLIIFVFLRPYQPISKCDSYECKRWFRLFLK